MLANPKEILLDAEKNNYAIAGINATTLESVVGMIEAAEELGAPVMISHAQSHEPFAPIDIFGPIFVDLAHKAKVPVIIHLDHGVDYNYVIKAVRNGFTSIMYDCAHLPYEENARKVKDFTEIAHSVGIIVEAEVGLMPSNIVGQGGCTEYGAGIDNIRDYYTKPEEASMFVKETGIDMLATSFGTVHGLFVEEPDLDIKLLKEINGVTDCALVMHGGTGVHEDQLLEAVCGGIRKVNYYTGMGIAPAEAIEKKIKSTTDPIYYHEIADIAKKIMKEKAKYMIKLLQNN